MLILKRLLAMSSIRDEDVPRVRWLIRTLLWGNTFVTSIIAGIGLFAMAVHPERYWQFFVVSLALCLAVFFLHGMSHRKTSTAGLAIVGHASLDVIVLYIALATPPGKEALTFVLYSVPIFVSAAVFTPEAGFLWAGVAVLSTLARLLILHSLDWKLFFGITLTVVMLAVLARYIFSSFRRALRRLRLQVQKGTAGIEIGRAVLASLDPDSIATRSVHSIQEAFGYYQVALFLLPPGGDDRAVLADAAGEAIESFKARSRPVPVTGRTAVSYALRYGERVMVVTWRETVGPDNRRVEFTYKRLPARAELALPLMIGEQVVGVLDLYSVDLNPFPESDIHILEGLTSHIANALGIAHLVDDIRRRHQELSRLYAQTERRAHYLEAAADLAQAISTLAEPQDLLDRAVSIIGERLGHRHIGIFLADEAGEWAVLTVASSEEGRQLAAHGHRRPVNAQSAIGRVILEGRSHLRSHVDPTGPHDLFCISTTRSEVILPLRAGGRTIGALDVQSDREDAFEREDVALLQILADQIAMAVENARLFQSTQQALEEVRAIQRYYVSKEWERLVGRRADLVAEYRRMGVPPLPVDWSPEMNLALEKETPLALSDIGSVLEAEQIRAEETGSSARSALVVPIKLRDEVIGVLDLQELDESRHWTQDEIDMAAAVADQLALAMENARLFEEARRRAAQLAAAAEVARDATSILEVDQLLNETVHLISEQFGFYHAGVFLLDKKGEYAVLQAASSEGGKRMLKRGHKLRVGKVGIVGKVAATGEPHIALDVGRDAVHFVNPDLPDTHSEMGLPLRVRGRVIGVLDVQSTRVAAFTEDDVAVLQTLADQLAAAIANARLFQEVREEATRRALINEVLHAASTSLDPDELLHQAGEVISRLMRCPSALFIWDEDKEVLRPVAIHDERGDDVPFPPQTRISRAMNPALFEKVIDHQTAAFLKPLAEHIGKGPQMLARRLGIKQGAYVPLTSRDRVLGVLVVAADEMSPSMMDFLEVVGANLSVALENAHLYQEAVHTAERLKEMDRLKSQFLANMSHELRTPLNSIIGFSRVILKGIDGPLTDMQRTDLQAVYDSGQHLLGLINDILDISKIQAGKMELSFEETDLRDIVKGVMSTAIALVKDKPIELQQAVAPDLPIVRADSRRIRQVLLNLVGNAAKFTERGFIRVEANYNEEEDTVLLTVVDSGIGIPPDKIDTIFEEFTQVDGSSTRRAGGTGLGLSISRHFVEMHGGRIWVESTAGVGSAFYVELPVKGPPPPGEEPVKPKRKIAPSSTAEPPPEGGKKPVLCVDDDAGVITLFRRYLSKHGYQVIGVTDSRVVLERAKQLQPFAITLDVLMPGQDGWTVMQELKSDPATRHIPVIVCSIVGEKDRGLSLGASDYLVKPILEDDLVKALERLDHTTDRHLVLVVDDNADDRALLRRMIENLDGYEVIEAAGGEEAIMLVKERRPDLITLDLMMPEIDGFAVLESLKADPMTRSIPIIVITAKDLTPEEREKLNQGVEALLQKGLFRQQELLADVAAALDRILAAEKRQ